jgi:iron complex outermembrane receptor protein
LAGVPGLLARDRQNFAQDTQLSIRGFGARSTFGVRGVRVLIDGVPATMPDGQGQLSHASLLGAERIEALRGPFSALYGNSSGGVLQVWSAQGQAGDPWRLRVNAGADNTLSVGAQLKGAGRAGLQHRRQPLPHRWLAGPQPRAPRIAQRTHRW